MGTLVTSATFRLPGPLSIQVAGVDQMSGGRVELGLGAGWYEAEHEAYGIPFPAVGERFDRLEEQLAVVTGLWATPTGETFSHAGAHYPVADSPGLTRPVQAGGVPIIIGGGGKRRTPSLAVRYAAEFNGAFQPAAAVGDLFARVREVARENGLAGSPAEVLEKLAGFAGFGTERMYLQVLDLADLDHLTDLAEALLP